MKDLEKMENTSDVTFSHKKPMVSRNKVLPTSSINFFAILTGLQSSIQTSQFYVEQFQGAKY